MNSKFGKLYYKGKELDFEGLVDNTVHEIAVDHYYNAPYSNLKDRRRHTCLQVGFWCWKQAREEPFRALKFLIKRIKLPSKKYPYDTGEPAGNLQDKLNEIGRKSH